jgi:hypothetical protein
MPDNGPSRRGLPARRAAAAAAIVLSMAAVLGVSARQRGEREDPLAAEIARWSSLLASHASGDENWAQVKEATEPALRQAEEAVRAGRPLFALQRLAAAREYLAATEYVERRPAGERSTTGFEAEWARVGQVLRDDLAAPAPSSFDTVRPAAIRAVAEAAWRQVRVYYEASLEYGRNTMPDSGLYYVGVAQAQHDLVALCRSLASPASGGPPALRSLQPELDALESDVLAAYRPPASIERHTEFIRLSAIIKEARELDGAGLRYGALLRYLQAALRFAPLRAQPAPANGAAVKEALGRFRVRFDGPSADHSLARLFMEQAEADPATAAAVADDVLPRYAAAIAPARPAAAPKPSPRVTVTLVRWPYT